MTSSTPRNQDAFNAHLAQLHMRGQWETDAALNTERVDGPRSGALPYLWKWSTVRDALSEACEVVPESFTARRTLAFLNPGLKDPGTTRTLSLAIQLVNAGEVAWAHRHSMAALRLGIEGSKQLYTVVNGEVLPMEPGDLVLTPSLTWHDHQNRSDEPGIWLDVIDAPLVGAIGQRWYEPFGDSVQPLRAARGDYLVERARPLRPTWEHRQTVAIPYRYAWRDVREALDLYDPTTASPYDGVRLEYVNPMTGGPTLPTIGCFVQKLAPGSSTAEHQHTSNDAFFVVAGRGRSVIEDTVLEWGKNDVFIIPTWMRHRHINDSPDAEAILFSVTDKPLLDALGLYRETPTPSGYLKPPPVVPGNTPPGSISHGS